MIGTSALCLFISDLILDTHASIITSSFWNPVVAGLSLYLALIYGDLYLLFTV